VFGYQLGALVGVELGIARLQQVRRVMLWGVPAWSAQDRAALMAPPMAAGMREDGSDVADEWRRMLEQRGPGVSIAALAEDFGDRLRSGVNGDRAAAAALDFPVAERLPLLKQQTLVMRLKDEFGEHAQRTRAALPNGSLLDLPDYGQGFISAAPQRFAAVAREFLDR
jgi:pimeloyl-ACP methyl ester carboxylesterase